MTIDRISFSETIETMDEYGRKHWVKTSAEGSLSPEDNIPQCYNELKAHALNALYQKNNPHLYQQQDHQYVKTPPDFEGKTGIPYIYTNSPQMFETQPVKLSPQDEENNLITSIESAKNEQELIQYKLLAAKNSKTTGAYNRRKKQLNITN
jgi:hypothetical protein